MTILRRFAGLISEGSFTRALLNVGAGRALGLSLVALISSGLKAQQCTFDSDDECWTAVGDASNMTHFTAGGNPGGYIRATDLNQGIAWRWLAPDYFHGNKSASYGLYLRFDRKTTNPGSPNPTDALMSGNGINIQAQCGAGVGTAWSTCSLQMDPSVWKYAGTTMNVSAGDLQLVLSDVTDLRILGEYSTSVDMGSLDNVVLEPTTLPIATPGPICSGASVGFYGVSVINPTSWQWQFSGGVPTTISQQDALGISYPNAGTWSVQLTTTHECQSDTITQIIAVGDVIVMPTWATTVDATICPGASYALPDGTLVSASGAFPVTLSTAGGCDSTVTTVLALAQSYALLDTVVICAGSSYLFNGQLLTTPGDYQSIWPSIAGCDSTVFLTLELNPAIEMALTVVDIVCPGDSSGSFQVSAADGVAPYSITLGNDTIGIDVAFTGLLAGVYPFTLTDAAGCSLNGSATIAEPAPIVLSVSPENAVIEIGDPQPMLVTSNYDIDLVLWSPDIGLSCAGCVDPTYTGDSTEQFHVEALVDVNDALCPAMTDATVQVRARLFAPNAFTPNGDGINDVFAAVGLNLESFEAFEIRITDRWGRQLFLSKSPLFNWTGGDEPNGVYAWNIEYRQPGLTGIKRAQGHVALIR